MWGDISTRLRNSALLGMAAERAHIAIARVDIAINELQQVKLELEGFRASITRPTEVAEQE